MQVGEYSDKHIDDVFATEELAQREAALYNVRRGGRLNSCNTAGVTEHEVVTSSEAPDRSWSAERASGFRPVTMYVHESLVYGDGEMEFEEVNAETRFTPEGSTPPDIEVEMVPFGGDNNSVRIIVRGPDKGLVDKVHGERNAKARAERLGL